MSKNLLLDDELFLLLLDGIEAKITALRADILSYADGVADAEASNLQPDVKAKILHLFDQERQDAEETIARLSDKREALKKSYYQPTTREPFQAGKKLVY